MNTKEYQKVEEWFNTFCYENGLENDIIDFKAEIDNTLSVNENIELLEARLSVLRTPILKPETYANNYTINDWKNDTLKGSKILIITGSRNSGKSCLGFELLNWHTKVKRNAYIYQHPQPSLLPSFVKNCTDLDKLKESSVVLLDEAILNFNQYSYNKEQTQALSRLLATCRHDGLSVIFIIQNTSLLTRDVRRLADCFLLKTPSLMQKYDEQAYLKKCYKDAEEFFSNETNRKKGFYVINSHFKGGGLFDLCPEWTEDLSRAYSKEEVINLSGGRK